MKAGDNFFGFFLSTEGRKTMILSGIANPRLRTRDSQSQTVWSTGSNISRYYARRQLIGFQTSFLIFVIFGKSPDHRSAGQHVLPLQKF